MDLPKLSILIKVDLERARNTLPEDAASREAIDLYREFLGQNELGLACDMLEEYAENQKVSKEFWLALGDAATRMKLSD
jgi:hypothetical protein